MLEYQEPPSAWVQELERESPTILSDVVVVADPDEHPELNPYFIAYNQRLEAEFGSQSCKQFIAAYDGPNPLWRVLFNDTLYRDCGYTMQLTPDEERPMSVDQSSGYFQPLPEE